MSLAVLLFLLMMPEMIMFNISKPIMKMTIIMRDRRNSKLFSGHSFCVYICQFLGWLAYLHGGMAVTWDKNRKQQNICNKLVIYDLDLIRQECFQTWCPVEKWSVMKMNQSNQKMKRWWKKMKIPGIMSWSSPGYQVSHLEMTHADLTSRNVAAASVVQYQ